MIAAERPKTVGSVREDHLALIRDWREINDDAERAERAKALRLRVKEAGRDIAAPGERDEAQGLIDYWASAISGLSAESYPQILTLDAYVGEAAKRAGESARQVFDGLATEEERRAARKLFEDLLYLGPNGVERGAPRTRALLQQSIGGTVLDVVLERFEETGAISRLAGETPSADRFEASDPRVCEDWPELRQWLEDLGTYNEARSRFMMQAERWRIAKDDPLQLARGVEVDTIDRFRGETDLLDAFIDASKKARGRDRTIRTLWFALAPIMLMTVAFLIFQRNEAVDGRKKAQLETGELLAQQDYVAPLTSVDPGAGSLPPPIVYGATQRAALPGVSGALWLGSIERPQVGPERTGARFVPIDRAADGAVYRVRVDINLREGLPSSDYVRGPATAIIPAGTLVIVSGAPRAYDRPTGPQYWANVRVVPRVYVQYANGDRAAIDSLRRLLANAGFDVPPAEATASAAGLSEVRYFNAVDRRTGEYLVTTLRASEVAAARNVGCQSFANSRLKGQNFIVELWIDLERGRSPQPRAGC